MKGDFDKVIEFCKRDSLPKAHKELAGLFRLHDYVSDNLDHACNLHNFADLAPGQLQIAVTRLPFLERERFQTFTSQEDLKSCLFASTAVFPLAPLIHHRGSWYVDGGVTDFFPIVDQNTITVSPFYFSSCDIKPSRYVPVWWAIIPPNNYEAIEWVYALGFEDAMAFFDSKQMPRSPHERSDMKMISTRGLAYDLYTTPCSLQQQQQQQQQPSDDEMMNMERQRQWRRRNVSLHRVIGYHMPMHHVVERVLDMCLLVLFIMVWKPLALVLIYCELLLRLVMHTLSAVLADLMESRSYIVLLSSVLVVPHLLHVGYVSLFLYARKLMSTKAADLALKFSDAGKCLLCLVSLSLLLRFFSLSPAPKAVNKHSLLEEISLIYRIFQHII